MQYTNHSLENIPQRPQTKAGHADVYMQRLSDIAKVLRNPMELTNVDDHNHAEHFRQAIHREQALATRAATRFVLALYAKQAAQTLSIKRTHTGKPYLVDHPELHFSVSHSKTFFAMAVAPNKVGIDIEEYDTAVDIFAVSQKYFSPQEQRYMQKQHNPFDAFYTIWTAKEALVKCHDTSVEKVDVLRYPDDGLAKNFRQLQVTALSAGPVCYSALATHDS